MSIQKKIAIGAIFIAAIIITAGILINNSVPARDPSEESAELPILMFHHIVRDEPVTNSTMMSLEHFEKIISALYREGFHTVNFDELIAYTESRENLPNKPILITFDDGYASVIELAKPVLEKYNMQATVFAIGVSVGKTTYKDTNIPITPHFTWEQALQARDVISVQSHSYDMHNVSQLDLQDFRSGVLKKDGESETDYRNAFRGDIRLFKDALQKNLNTPLVAFSYPYGLYTDTSEFLLKEAGIKATVTSDPGINHLKKGDPESLYLMNRIEVIEEVQPDELMSLLSNF